MVTARVRRSETLIGAADRCYPANCGEVVLAPWGGIVSTGYVAALQGRCFLGCELNPEWWAEGVRNLRRADETARPKDDLLSLIEAAG